MEKDTKNIDFEGAMSRLEKITEELAREGIKLEDALSLYEEGVGLVKECNKTLEQTERKIKALQLSANGELEEKDFGID